MKKLQAVDVSFYSNNAIHKEDGRFYMRSEVDDVLREYNALRKAAEEFVELYQNESLGQNSDTFKNLRFELRRG